MFLKSWDMQSNYKPIGDYIQLVDERNKGLNVKQLLGLSISKQFIPSVANIIGTDMENYKIIRKNQFACSTMQVRRDKKMPVALLQEVDEAIISQAYPIFEVKDEKELLPEYLMMWFSREEFDREACFHAVGGVRGSLEWEDFCTMKFPLPSPEKQREIVAEYNTVKNRIELNNRLIQKLEETAQAIYKQWFIDYEFPDENGNPYKSSGGNMVWNEELDKEIPEGWEASILSSLIEVKYGKDYKHLNSGNIPLYGSGGIMGYVNDVLYSKPSVLIPRKGSLNNILYLKEPFWSVDTMFFSKLRKEFYGRYVYYYLSSINFNSLNVGSAVPSMTTQYLNGMVILKPIDEILKTFENLIDKIGNQIEFRKKQNIKLINFQSVLLSKVATIEN